MNFTGDTIEVDGFFVQFVSNPGLMVKNLSLSFQNNVGEMTQKARWYRELPLYTHLENVHFGSRAGLATNNEHQNVVVHFDGVVASECRWFLN